MSLAWHVSERQPDPHKSQRPQNHYTWQYSVTENQQQWNNAPASNLAQHCLRQESAGRDMQGKTVHQLERQHATAAVTIAVQNGLCQRKSPCLANFPSHWWVGCRVLLYRESSCMCIKADILTFPEHWEKNKEQWLKMWGEKIHTVEKLCFWDSV